MRSTLQFCVQLEVEAPMSDSDKAAVRDDLQQLLISHYEDRDDPPVGNIDVLPMAGGVVIE